MRPADLIAIVLLLAALIGCANHLWSRLPPADRHARRLARSVAADRVGRSAVPPAIVVQGLTMLPLLRRIYGAKEIE